MQCYLCNFQNAIKYSIIKTSDIVFWNANMHWFAKGIQKRKTSKQVETLSNWKVIVKN